MVAQLKDPSPIIQVREVDKSFVNQGKQEKILDQVSFDIRRGEIIALLGHSGCGKSTLLNMICGFQRPDAGSILLDGEPVLKPNRRCVMLFQNYGLLPWRTVLKNVEFALEGTATSSEERRELALRYLRMVDLEDKAGLFPRQLSGGMQQRVAIARALAYRPALLLMDEPFGSVDAQTREDLEDLLLRVREHHNMTIILITHDIDESVYVGDRVVVLSSAPARVRGDLRVDLPAPRDQIATRELPEFVRLRAEVGRLVRRKAEQEPAAAEPAERESAEPAEPEPAEQGSEVGRPV